MALRDPVKLEIARKHTIEFKICRYCGARNALKAVKCRRCRSKNLRLKKKKTGAR